MTKVQAKGVHIDQSVMVPHPIETYNYTVGAWVTGTEILGTGDAIISVRFIADLGVGITSWDYSHKEVKLIGQM